MKKNNIFRFVIILFTTLLMYIFYNYYKYHLQQRSLKIINNTDRKVDYLISENVFNLTLFEMSKPYFNSSYYVKGKLVTKVVENKFIYYSKKQLKEFTIPNNDWEDFLENDKNYKLFILDVDSLKSLNNLNKIPDSTAIKKVILKEIKLNIKYLDNNNLKINFDE